MVKNWKVTTMYLTIVTVIIEIIMKRIVLLMNKDNKWQYFKVKKQTMNQSKRACPSILNVKRPNIYTHKLTHKLE